MTLDEFYQSLERQRNLPVGWLSAIQGAENSGDTATSPKGARGRFQFMPATAARFGLDDPTDPAKSAVAAADYGRVLSKQFGGNPALMLAGYNAGEGNVKKYGGIPPFPETQSYVERGLRLLRDVGKGIVNTVIPAAKAEAAPSGSPLEALNSEFAHKMEGGLAPPSSGNALNDLNAEFSRRAGNAATSPSSGNALDDLNAEFAHKMGTGPAPASTASTSQFDIPADFESSLAPAQSPVSATAPSGLASIGRGAAEEGRQLWQGFLQRQAYGGDATDFIGAARRKLGPPGAEPSIADRIREYETERKISDAAAQQRNASYEQAHPYLFGGGKIMADIGASIPLLAVSPSLPVISGGTLPAIATQTAKRAAMASLLGASQGAVLGGLHPVDVPDLGLTPEEFAAAKFKQTGESAFGGALLGPAVDLGLLGTVAALRSVPKVVGKSLNWLMGSESPLSSAALQAAEKARIQPTYGDISGNPMAQNLEAGLQYVPGGWSLRGKYAQDTAGAKSAANELRGKPADEAGARVAQEIVSSRASRLEGQQSAVSRMLDAFKPKDPSETQNGGIQAGLSRQLEANRGEIRRAYGGVDQVLQQQGMAGSPIPTPNTQKAASDFLREINPETWRSVSNTRLTSALQAISEGINDTKTLQRMPMENLMTLADNAYQRAAALYPEVADSIPFPKDRGGAIDAIVRWNHLAAANPAEILGPRPAGVQGILQAVRKLGGLKQDYMADAVGESKVQKGMLPGVFTKAGRSPDDLARALQEDGFPIDASPDGIDKMYAAINSEMSGAGKSVRLEDVGKQQLQQEYEDRLVQAVHGKSQLPDEWLPGQALDFKGLQALDKDLSSAYQKARRASGGVGSAEERVFAGLKQALLQDAEGWANSTGSPEVMQALNVAKGLHQALKVPYSKQGVPGVNAVISGKTSDRAAETLFNPAAPDRAEQAFSLLDADGRKSAKLAVMARTLSAATKAGEFSRDDFLSSARQQMPLIRKMFSPAEQKAFGDLADQIGSAPVNSGLERAAQKAIDDVNPTAFMTQFSSSQKSDAGTHALMSKLSPDGKTAVSHWVLDSAYRYANDDIGGHFSLAKYATFLKNHQTVLESAGQWDSTKGLVELFDRMQRVAQYSDNPVNGSRMATLAGMNAVFGGMIAALGSVTGASTAGAAYGLPKLMTMLLTSPRGIALLSSLGRKSGEAARMQLVTPAWQRGFLQEFSRISAISAAAIPGQQGPAQELAPK